MSPPPPKGKKTDNGMNGNASSDVFGSDPFFTSTPSDPFGMSAFGTPNRMLTVNGNSNRGTLNPISNGFGLDAFSNVTQPQAQQIDNKSHILDERIKKIKNKSGTPHDDIALQLLDPLWQSS